MSDEKIVWTKGDLSAMSILLVAYGEAIQALAKDAGKETEIKVWGYLKQAKKEIQDDQPPS